MSKIDLILQIGRNYKKIMDMIVRLSESKEIGKNESLVVVAEMICNQSEILNNEAEKIKTKLMRDK